MDDKAETLKQFLTFLQAIEEILSDFRSDREQYDLFGGVYTFIVGGKATPGKKKCPPVGIKYPGIWYQPINSKERIFYNSHDFDDLLTQAFSLKELSGEDIITLYKMVMGVNAYMGIGPGSKAGLWVDTEMEKFKCIQCGHCCLNLSDAYCASADARDMIRWEEEDRWDILDHIVWGDLWISPNTGEELNRCPWLRKLPNKNKYNCRIHDTKPQHCRNYPKSKKHALRTGCKGFNPPVA